MKRYFEPFSSTAGTASSNESIAGGAASASTVIGWEAGSGDAGAWGSAGAWDSEAEVAEGSASVVGSGAGSSAGFSDGEGSTAGAGVGSVAGVGEGVASGVGSPVVSCAQMTVGQSAMALRQAMARLRASFTFGGINSLKKEHNPEPSEQDKIPAHLSGRALYTLRITVSRTKRSSEAG